MSELDISKLDPDIAAVAERARKAAWECEPAELQTENLVTIKVPNGRGSRGVLVTTRRASILLSFRFEEYRILGDYRAINHPQTNYAEVLIRPTERLGSPFFVGDIPGSERIGNVTSPESADDGSSKESEKSTDTDTQLDEIDDMYNRRLVISDDKCPWSLELSPMTDRFSSLIPTRFLRNRRPATLKIHGIDAPRHDDAVRRLEEIGGAFLFDLDLRYGILLEMSQQPVRAATQRYEFQPMGQPPTLPRLHYPNEALSLYKYGRSATQMPLLQFLAYYQVLEFFFPMHSQQQALRKLRQTIIDPRFDAGNDADLARVLKLASANSRSGYGNEREQLKATIYACVDDAVMLEFLHMNLVFFRPLMEKKTIKDIPVLDEANRGIPFLDQVVARVYALRNRVVHAKADGGEMAVELLLPGSAEAKSMAADVALVQFLAQKAIVVGGTRLT